MAEKIDELVEQNAKQVEVLRALLEPTKDQIDNVRNAVQEATEHTSAMDNLSGQLKNILAELEGLADKLESAQQQTTSVLGSLEGRAESTGGTLSSALESLTDVTEQTSQLAATAQENLATRRSELDETFKGLTEGSKELAGFCDEQEKVAGELSATLVAAAVAVDTRFSDLGTLITEGIDEAEEASRVNLRAISEGFGVWTETAEEGFGTAAASCEEAVSRTLEGLQSNLVGEGLEKLGSSADDVIKAFGDAMEVVSDIGAQLDGSVGEVTEQLEEIVEIIETVRPVLDTVEELLG